MVIVTVGTNLTKNVFAVHGVEEAGEFALHDHAVRLTPSKFVASYRLAGRRGKSLIHADFPDAIGRYS